MTAAEWINEQSEQAESIQDRYFIMCTSAFRPGAMMIEAIERLPDMPCYHGREWFLLTDADGNTFKISETSVAFGRDFPVFENGEYAYTDTEWMTYDEYMARTAS